MHSRRILFDREGTYTRLRLAWGDGLQRVQDYFSELKEQKADPDRQELSSRLDGLLPHRELPASQRLRYLKRSGELQLPHRGPAAMSPPQIVVLVDDEVRCGPARNTPGAPDFAGSELPDVLRDDMFWVRADELPPDRDVLISIVSPGLIDSLRARHSDRQIGGARVSDLGDIQLLEAVFSDELLGDLDIARILSNAPTVVMRSDETGSVEMRIAVQPQTPCLTSGSFAVVVTAPANNA